MEFFLFLSSVELDLTIPNFGYSGLERVKTRLLSVTNKMNLTMLLRIMDLIRVKKYISIEIVAK